MANISAKSIIQPILSALWLREGTVRQSWLGPYRGLKFGLKGPGLTRLGIFYRAYEQNVTDWLQRNIQPGMTVYVIGAHVGIHALYIAKLLRGQGRVYAFEAWLENSQILEWNIRLNTQLHTEIVLQRECVSNHSGSVMMAKGNSDGKHHIVRDVTDEEEVREMLSISLDDFWSQTNQCPDLILVDIEGHELEALQGAERLINSCKPKLGLEHHEHILELINWLDQHHYIDKSHDKRHIFTE